jgi:2-polyprenyl-3-methyl-5-hydroxy-6-metoxy-1,4-benzoquinol methylase
MQDLKKNMAQSMEEALEIVNLRKLSDVAFFHKLESLGLPTSFATSYSIEEMRHADSYDASKVAREYSPLIRILRDFREQNQTNKKILDFGAGAGTLARYLQENQFEIETADNQPISVATAREVYRLVSYLVTSPENIGQDLQNRKYGLIMLNRVLEQPVMDDETALHLMNTLATRLDNKGYFIISTSTGIVPIDELQRSFGKVERLEITPTNTVRKVYRIRN